MASPHIGSNSPPPTIHSDEPAHTTPPPSSPTSTPTSRRTAVVSGALAGLAKANASASESGKEAETPPASLPARRGFAALPKLIVPSKLTAAAATLAAAAEIPLPASPTATLSAAAKPPMPSPQRLEEILTKANEASEPAQLHELLNELPANNPACEKQYTAISAGLVKTLQKISDLPQSERPAEAHRCMASYAKMEPSGMREAGYEVTFAFAAKSVPAEHHQALFDNVFETTKQTVPHGEQSGVLLCLMQVPFPPGYGQTPAESEKAANNIVRVLDNMKGITASMPAGREMNIIKTALTQGNELVEPGFATARAAIMGAVTRMKAAAAAASA